MADIFQQDEQFKNLLKDIYDTKIAIANEKDTKRLLAEKERSLAEYISETAPILIEFSDLNKKYIRKNTGMSGIDAFFAPRIESFSGIITEEAYEAKKKELIDKFYNAQSFISRSFKFTCPRCRTVPVLEEGLYVCPDCHGIVATSMVNVRKNADTNLSSYSKTRYKRSARLQEVISKYAESSSSCMTYHQVVVRITELLAAESKPANEKNIEAIMKQESIKSSQFDHRVIIDIIMNSKKSYISDDDIAGVMYIFEETNEVYYQACKEVQSERINFFSYDFFIGRALRKISKTKYHEYEHLISTLRERDNLFAQMAIWKKVCELRGWDDER